MNINIQRPYIKNPYRIVALLIVLSSLVICVDSVFITPSWINKYSPGFFLFRNMIVSPDRPPKWTGEQAGLKFYDQIVELNDMRVSSPEQVYNFVDSKPLGTVITYTVSRDNKLFKLSIPTMKFTFLDFFMTFGVISIIGFNFLIIGNLVYYLRPSYEASKIFQIFCFLVGTWFISVFDSQSEYSLDILYPAIILTPASAIYLILLFPSKKEFVKKYPWVGLLTFFISMVLLVLYELYFDYPEVWVNIDKLCWLYVFVVSLLFVISSAMSYFKSDSTLDKQRAQIVLLGAFAGFALPALGTIIVTLFNVNIYFNYLAIPVIFFPLSIAYAIVKHNLFDIDEIVKKGLTYTALTGVAGTVFGLAIVGFNWILADYGGWKHPVTFIAPAILMILLVSPLKDRIQDIIDTVFFRKKYDYSKTISELSAAMTSILDIDEIANKIINTITETMLLSSGALLLLDQNTGDYQVYVTTIDDLNKDFTLKVDNPLIIFLNRYKKEIFKEDLIAEQEYIIDRDELMKSFQELRASVFIPFFFKGQLLGILSLGEKKSGLMYTSRDVKLIRTLANQSAIAVENAFAYRMIEDYAKKLVEANKELRETQVQLIQSEKMSAIGRLAAGIAHEIRNPLNIIEGARYYLSQMIKGENSTVMEEYLDYIKHEIERTNRLIDSLLKFSRVETPRFGLLDVNSVVENTLVLLRKQLSDSHIKLITNLDHHIPNIMGDSNQLWQVFINIIINAIQAMPKGGELRVDTGLYYGSLDRIFISFTDTGMGIDEKDFSGIFDPFFTTKDTGTGLGLSISYRIIEEHKGRIIVSSEKGKGSTFVVELPVSHNNKGVEDDGEQKSLGG